MEKTTIPISLESISGSLKVYKFGLSTKAVCAPAERVRPGPSLPLFSLLIYGPSPSPFSHEAMRTESGLLIIPMEAKDDLFSKKKNILSELMFANNILVFVFC
jgi:hypothetical protein